jgi:hypothetical protein
MLSSARAQTRCEQIILRQGIGEPPADESSASARPMNPHGKPVRKGRINKAILALLFVTSLEVVTLVACGIRRGDVVLLENRFEGWVVIRYDVAGRPALERNRVHNLIQVPASGEVSTSSSRSTGYGFDVYYIVDATGDRRRLATEAENCQDQDICIRQFQLFSSPTVMTRFFVGTKDDLIRSPKPPSE